MTLVPRWVSLDSRSLLSVGIIKQAHEFGQRNSIDPSNFNQAGFLGVNNWHQPFGVISPWTNLQAFGGWKLLHSPQ